MSQEDTFVVQGIVRQENNTAYPGGIVRAYDKDMRSEQLLGETPTDDKGYYRISYTASQFRRAEKDLADLIVRVFHPKAEDLKLAESDLLFNAGPVTNVDLTVRFDCSTYELYLAMIDPLREGVPVANLTAEDITFLARETGLEPLYIEFLVTAARLGQETQLPPAVFFGFAYEGLPTTLPELLQLTSQVQNQALTKALDGNIIPRTLREDLPTILERLQQLSQVSPERQQKTEEIRLTNVAKVAGLQDATLKRVMAQVKDLAGLTDTTLKPLVQAQAISDQEAKTLGLNATLYRLLDDNLKLVKTLQLQNRVSQIRDLVALPPSAWVDLLNQTQATPPDGLKQEAYATLLTKRVENLYPSDAFLSRTPAPPSDNQLLDSLGRLEPLFERNEQVFAIQDVTRLNTDGLTPRQVEIVKDLHPKMTRLANRYPGLRLHSLLDDRTLSTPEKVARMRDRINLVGRFRSQNPNVEFLNLNYAYDSEDLRSLNFQGFDADSQRMVVDYLKTSQRLYSITKDANHAQQFMEAGHHSAWSIANSRPDALEARTGIVSKQVKDYRDIATGVAVKSALTALGVHPALYGALTSGFINAYLGLELQQHLSQINGYAELFGNLAYCQCEHCQSILSPAAYFVDLMYFVEQYILDHSASPLRSNPSHALHLRNRRPDLWTLPLTCENTNTLIPYLDIINEVLENYICHRRFPRISLPEVGQDRGAVENAVYSYLQNLAPPTSFQLPFDLPLEKLRLYLSHFDLSRGEIAALLEAPSETQAAATLGLSHRDYGLITQPETDVGGFFSSLYGLNFEVDRSGNVTFHDPSLTSGESGYEASQNDVQILLKAMGITRQELGDLIQTDFVGNGCVPGEPALFPEIRSDRRTTDSLQNDIERIRNLNVTALDRMHRFIRLWRQLPWSIRELDLALSSHGLTEEGNPHAFYGIGDITLRIIATLTTLQKRFRISVEELCAVWARIPRCAIKAGQASLFDRLFNPPGLSPLNITSPFLHPAFRATPPTEVDHTLHRLLAGLQVSDETLYELIVHLSEPLGIDLTSTNKRFVPNHQHLSYLYRHARLAEWLKLSVPDLFQLIRLAATLSSRTLAPYPSTYVGGLHQLVDLLEFYDWWQTTPYSLDDLELLLNPAQAAAKAPSLRQSLLAAIQGARALPFAGTLLAFLTGITEEQSRAIIAAHPDIEVARAYQLADKFEDATWVIPAGLSVTSVTETAIKDYLTDLQGTEAPLFRDTLFVGLSGLTEADSREIVAANDQLLQPIWAEEPLYWLTDRFDPTVPVPTFTNKVFAQLAGVTEAQSRAIVATQSGWIVQEGTAYRLSDRFDPTALALTFAETIFSHLPGVTPAQSRQIVADNPTVIIPISTPDGPAFRLAENFSPTTSLTVPSGIPVSENDLKSILLAYWAAEKANARGLLRAYYTLWSAKAAATVRMARDLYNIELPTFGALLSLYHAREIVPTYLAPLLGIPVDKAKALIQLTGIDLTAPGFTQILKGFVEPSALDNLVAQVLTLSVLFQDPAFDADALYFIHDHPDWFDLSSITLARIQSLCRYRRFLDHPKERQAMLAALETVLAGFSEFNPRFYLVDSAVTTPALRDQVTAIQSALAQLLGTEVGSAITLHEEIPRPNTAFEALTRLKDCAELSQRLGIGAEVLPRIVSDGFDHLTQASNAIYAAFRAKYDETEWQQKIEPFENKLRARKRDALTEYLIRHRDFPWFTHPNDLYHYFLLDVELEGCARTSRVVAATNSVQLYVHRVLMNLEQDRAGTMLVSLQDASAVEEWEWRQNYRVWEANRKVFLYPENYLEPDLRDNKTPLFEDLESTLLQQEINEDTVLDAYAAYMRSFDEVAKLKISGAYHDIDYANDTDILHLFGVTTSEPFTHYYRTVENVYHGEIRDDREAVWSPWRKIEVQTPVDKVSPIVYRNRLHLFWVEITTSPDTSLEDGTSKFIGYKHTMSLKFTTLRLDGTWMPPQKVSLNYPPFNDGDGTVYDPLLEGKSVFVSKEGKYPYALIPKYGSNIDKHMAPASSSLHFYIDIFSPPPKISEILENYKFEAKDKYTLSGFRWNRVYPNINSSGQLILTGRDFQMRSPIDFYHLASGPLDTAHTRFGVPGRDQSISTVSLLCAQYEGSNIGPTLYNAYIGYIFGDTAGVWLDPYANATILLERERINQFLKVWDLDCVRYRLNQGFYSYDEARQEFTGITTRVKKIATLSSPSTLEVINGSLSDVIVDCAGDLLYLQTGAKSCLIKRIGTTLTEEVSIRLFTGGVDTLLNLETQRNLKEAALPIEAEDDSTIGQDCSNAGKLDFTGPYGTYYREIFLHIPLLIANHLNSQQQFAAAQKWYHYVFNPTAREEFTPELTPAQKKEERKNWNWRYREFREYRIETFREKLTEPKAIAAYKKDPFNPHAIARLRLSAYQKGTVMKYIDNLLDWGDSLFAQDTMESINEATLLYVLAADILGDRPAELGKCTEGEVQHKTYNHIKPWLERGIENETGSEFLIEMEHVVSTTTARSAKDKSMVSYDYVMGPATLGFAMHKAKTRMAKETSLAAAEPIDTREGRMVSESGLNLFRGKDWKESSTAVAKSAVASETVKGIMRQIGPAFCIPENKDLKDYWDRVEDRLYKIRNCMNISGVRRALSLFAPEINPMLLVRAKAAGLSIEDVLNSISGNLPPYRFSYLIEKAKQYAAVLQGFGSALLGTLEKREAEYLNQLYTVHQKNILNLTTQVREQELEAAKLAVEALQKRQLAIENRQQYYKGLIDCGLNQGESGQLVSLYSSLTNNALASPLYLTAAIICPFPRRAGTSVSTGAEEAVEASKTWAKVANVYSNLLKELAAIQGINGGYARREEAWQFSVDQAEDELKEIEKQITAAEIRRDIAEQSLTIHNKTIEQQNEIYEFYRDKFTNYGLYTWLSSSLQRLYREAYNSAYAMAKLAEQAYRFERGDDAPIFIGPNHWDASKAGLLAGENLLMDLQNLERRFLETNYRTLEIDQAFSLTQVNPAALIQLKAEGRCNFAIPEFFFNLFYPGHYRRKIKAVRLTIPCITGPYTNVSASLSLTTSWLRNEPKSGSEYLKAVPRTRTVSIATSTAQNDAGVFELNFRDERYMPFEGAGAISEWELRLPQNFRQFDYQTINDVIIHISYTAEFDESLRLAVEGENTEAESAIREYLTSNSLPRVFSLRQDFSNAFHRLLHNAVGHEVKIEIAKKHFPIFLQDSSLTLRRAVLILDTPQEQDISDFAITINGRTDGLEFSRSPEFGNLWTSDNIRENLSATDFMAEHALVISTPGTLAPTPTGTPGAPPDPSAIDEEKLKDIFLYLEYGL